MRERYYIYKITNLLTNENYIGQRKLKEGKDPLTDNYLGSGKIITEKVKEYGKENFLEKSFFRRRKTTISSFR